MGLGSAACVVAAGPPEHGSAAGVGSGLAGSLEVVGVAAGVGVGAGLALGGGVVAAGLAGPPHAGTPSIAPANTTVRQIVDEQSR